MPLESGGNYDMQKRDTRRQANCIWRRRDIVHTRENIFHREKIAQTNVEEIKGNRTTNITTTKEATMVMNT